MAIVKAQVVLQAASDLPEDRFVNTFHFSNDAAFATHAANIADALEDFYNSEVLGTYSISGVLSPYINRTLGEIRMYDMSTAMPRVPTLAALPLAALESGAAGKLPAEVACCLSFHGAAPVTARKRGRVYLGPFSDYIVSGATTTLPCRVSPDFLNHATLMAANLASTDVGWSVYSQAANAYYPVVAGWVDNAWDTQRRRGIAPTARTPFNV